MRISFDLDETLFIDPQRFPTEPELRFPLDRIYRDRLRRGTVRLLKWINESDCELWIYTTSFRTERYIRRLFYHYGIRIDRVINGQRHQREVQRGRRDFPAKYPSFYRIDLHVDDEISVYQNGIAYAFRVFLLKQDETDWTDQLMREITRINNIGMGR